MSPLQRLLEKSMEEGRHGMLTSGEFTSYTVIAPLMTIS
jgi:hypothetical protein